MINLFHTLKKQKKGRQIIVVNTKTRAEDKLPEFNYISGGLENLEIIKNVCNILEGGEIAFMKRKKDIKYN